MDNIWIILLISILGPIIGSAIGVSGKPKEIIMYNMLAFSAGVMLAISFLELIPESIGLSGTLFTVLGIIGGGFFMYLLDRLIPHIHPRLCSQEQGCHLEKTATYLILGIFLHNFPEGMAMATGVISGYKTTLAIAIAIAVHNIPEGICTSAPYYSCTGQRLRSFLLSCSTIIPLIIGFFLARYLFTQISSVFIGVIIALTAGLMIYISSDELIPVACCKNNSQSHSTIFSLIAGVVFVVIIS